jgi:hypothetical protein
MLVLMTRQVLAAAPRHSLCRRRRCPTS